MKEGLVLKTLVIAEKPNAAKALVKGLYKENFEFYEPYKKYKPPQAKVGYFESDNIVITYAKGHLLRMKTIEEYLGLPASPRNYDCLPYIPKEFELTLSDDVWYEDQFKVLNDLIHRNDISTIVHFGDPDNEGELIVREILAYFGNTKPVKRLWCNSMVPDVVANAYYDMEDDKKYTYRYYQAMARQRFDYLWGINISRLLTKKTGQNFPAGRVLVPIVKHIYDRDKEIENFVVSTSYGLTANVTKNDWKGNTNNFDPEINFVEIAEADNLAKVLNVQPKTVVDFDKKTKKLKPNKLFNLSAFQSQFNKEYGYDLNTSLKTIQKLYEKGFTTYPRTSVEYLSQKEAREMERVIAKLNAAGHTALKFDSKAPVFNDKKCIGGHTALTITTKIPDANDINNMSEAEQRAYAMIFNRTVSNFCPLAEIEEAKVKIQCGDYTFQFSGNKMLSPGFTAYEKRNIKAPIPDFEVGEQVSVSFETCEKKTSPPAKVTPSSLLAFLANPYTNELKEINKEDDETYYKLLKSGATLGTDATTAVIVENAQKYGYIALKKKSFSITEKGIAFIKLLDAFDINLYKEKNIEMNKEIVAIGNKAYTLEEAKQKTASELKDIFDRNQNSNVTINADLFTDSIGKCPKCGGEVVERANSFQCVNKDCSFYIYKQDKYFQAFGKKITTSIAKSLLRKGRVQLNKLKSKNGKEYSLIISVDYSGQYPKYTTSFPNSKK